MKRRNPLTRRTPLTATRGLTRSSAWTPRRRDTGPSRGARETVRARDRGCCTCCGVPVLGRPHNLQHRLARRMGGTRGKRINSPTNLITLFGTPTTECHGRVEARRQIDHLRGYWLKSHQDPAQTPVLHALFGWVLLTHDGGWTPAPPPTPDGGPA